MISMQTMEKPSLNPALRSFWTTKARNKVLYGGRASSKSWDAAGFSVFLTNQYKLRVLCARQIQNKIEESVYTTIKTQIERFGLLERFKILDNKIINLVTGSEYLFYGLWRHITEIKSLEGIDILWLEEAHALTEQQWSILEPTIRKDGSECWFIFNPQLVTDFVYKRFITNPPKNTIVRRINYNENPFLSKTLLDVIEAKKTDDYEEYQHIYEGIPRQDDNLSIIKRSWIEAAIDAHVKLGFKAEGKKVIGFDVADDGADKCANFYRHGSIGLWADEWKAGEDEILKSCKITYNKALELQAEIYYDSIGVGATSGAKFKELNEEMRKSIKYTKFNAGDKVHKPEGNYSDTKIKNKDFFANLKSQTWWEVADRFRNTFNAIHRGEKFKEDKLISIASDCPYLDKLKDELSTPKRDFDKNGRVKVESKEDLKKRGIVSPNIADAFIMSFAPTSAKGFFG